MDGGSSVIEVDLGFMTKFVIGSTSGQPMVVRGLHGEVWMKGKEILGASCFVHVSIVLYKTWPHCCFTSLL